MSSTYTVSYTSTFTEARARAVMRSVLGDFTAMKNAGLITADRAQEWHDAVLYALSEEALDMFQVGFTPPGGQKVALDYEVKDDGSIAANQRPGGVNYAAFPTNTRVNITLGLREHARAHARVLKYLTQRGWGTDGEVLTGDAYVDRQYSQSNYGLSRKKVGPWK